MFSRGALRVSRAGVTLERSRGAAEAGSADNFLIWSSSSAIRALRERARSESGSGRRFNHFMKGNQFLAAQRKAASASNATRTSGQVKARPTWQSFRQSRWVKKLAGDAPGGMSA